MKIVITGASGQVGRLLIPLLAAQQNQLLLVGRNAESLRLEYPNHSVCNYENLSVAAVGYDVLVHLAVLNSNAIAYAAAFEAVNVQLTCEVARKAQQANISRFIFISSVHALSQQTDYAKSKRAAAAALSKLQDEAGFSRMSIETVYLPLVYSTPFSGRFAALNKLPKPLANTVFHLLSAIKPTVHVSKIAAHILDGPSESQIILADTQINNSFYHFFSRLVDLAFACVATVGLGWLVVLLWILIKLETPGPGLFVQSRVGRNGKVFFCYKLRTMQTGTKEAATHQVSQTAITRLGHFLRRTKLDELPQIINILRNEISLVGPRPCLPVQTELLHEREIRGVPDIKPGITGYAQIKGVDMREPKALAILDAEYLKLQCLALDFKIILATAFGQGGKSKQVQ